MTVPLPSLGTASTNQNEGLAGMVSALVAWDSGPGAQRPAQPEARVQGTGRGESGEAEADVGSSLVVASSSHRCVRRFRVPVCPCERAGCACSHICVGVCPCGWMAV